MPHRQRFPVSVRHAFALAFDLAFRRDPLHSLVIPFLLRAPWVMVFGMLPPIAAGSERIPGWLVLLGIILLLGDFFTLRVKQKGVAGYANCYRPFFWNVGLTR